MKLTVLLAVLAAFAAAQDIATVEGVVVNRVTGAGIGGATVRFWNNTERYEIPSTETGAFQIAGIKPGDYNASAEKNGYFPPEPETFFADLPRYRFTPGADPVRLRFELNPPAVLRGRVIGIDGKPARAAVDLGFGRTADTDADGAFSFESLPPGSYTLLARPTMPEPIATADGIRTEAVPTYFPSALEQVQAESLMVRAGAELIGYEIRLQSARVYRVRGVVLDPAGRPAGKAAVQLRVRTAGGDPDKFFFVGGGGGRQAFSIRTGPFAAEPSFEEPVVTGEDGTFEFPSVRAGEWAVRAASALSRDEVRHKDIVGFGAATFSVERGDPDDLKVQLAAPFDLSGTVVLSDGSPLTAGATVAVTLYSENGHSSGGVNGGGDAVIRFDKVTPGPHEIRADVLAGNYYADSILLGSSNVTGQTVELTPASPPVKVVLKPAGAVRGTIEEAVPATVILFPRSFTGIGYSVQSGAGQPFELVGIPPGDYYAIALDRFDPRVMGEALRLRGLMPRATSVRVEPNSAVSVQLKASRAPE